MSGDGPRYPEYPGANEPGDGPIGQPPPPPAAWGQQPPAPSGPPPGDNQKAMWSMILGILSPFCCGVLTGIPAIILSIQAKREIALAGGLQTGGGMATAGLVLGIIASALWGLFLLFALIGLVTGA